MSCLEQKEADALLDRICFGNIGKVDLSSIRDNQEETMLFDELKRMARNERTKSRISLKVTELMFEVVFSENVNSQQANLMKKLVETSNCQEELKASGIVTSLIETITNLEHNAVLLIQAWSRHILLKLGHKDDKNKQILSFRKLSSFEKVVTQTKKFRGCLLQRPSLMKMLFWVKILHFSFSSFMATNTSKVILWSFLRLLNNRMLELRSLSFKVLQIYIAGDDSLAEADFYFSGILRSIQTNLYSSFEEDVFNSLSTFRVITNLFLKKGNPACLNGYLNNVKTLLFSVNESIQTLATGIVIDYLRYPGLKKYIVFKLSEIKLFLKVLGAERYPSELSNILSELLFLYFQSNNSFSTLEQQRLLSYIKKSCSERLKIQFISLLVFPYFSPVDTKITMPPFPEFILNLALFLNEQEEWTESYTSKTNIVLNNLLHETLLPFIRHQCSNHNQKGVGEMSSCLLLGSSLSFFLCSKDVANRSLLQTIIEILTVTDTTIPALLALEQGYGISFKILSFCILSLSRIQMTFKNQVLIAEELYKKAELLYRFSSANQHLLLDYTELICKLLPVLSIEEQCLGNLVKKDEGFKKVTVLEKQIQMAEVGGDPELVAGKLAFKAQRLCQGSSESGQISLCVLLWKPLFNLLWCNFIRHVDDRYFSLFMRVCNFQRFRKFFLPHFFGINRNKLLKINKNLLFFLLFQLNSSVAIPLKKQEQFLTLALNTLEEGEHPTGLILYLTKLFSTRDLTKNKVALNIFQKIRMISNILAREATDQKLHFRLFSICLFLAQAMQEQLIETTNLFWTIHMLSFLFTESEKKSDIFYCILRQLLRILLFQVSHREYTEELVSVKRIISRVSVITAGNNFEEATENFTRCSFEELLGEILRLSAQTK
eukprot:snap_masked-scaffold_4-processed-gene-5.21-mRNA-1 protein AED:1.00 eAED:1.00 QI:0/0/0/0/1/1/2/0/887